MTTTADQPMVPPRRPRAVWPYMAWDAILLAGALVTVSAFIVMEDLSDGFWDGYSVQAAATLLGGLALLVSIRLCVPNFAVAGIGVFGSAASTRVLGGDTSWLLLIIVASIIGAFVGVMLAVIVVGLRVPAWGASLGLSGLFGAASFRLIEPGDPVLLRGSRTVVDWGPALFVLVSLLTIATCGALFWMDRAPSGDDRVAPADDGTAPRRSSDMVWQAGTLVVSSALAAVAGTLLVLRVGVIDGRIGSDIARPIAVLLLAGVSLRGFGSGVVGLIGATVIAETLITWTFFLDWVEPFDQLIITGLVALVGVIVGGILELLTSRRPAPPGSDNAAAEWLQAPVPGVQQTVGPGTEPLTGG